jgi:DNA-binding transcriptional LysR family regulator
MHEPVENAELLAFTKAVEARSLSRAAAQLGVPRATIGRRLARLEERLGARLLRRTTRSLTLTDAGDTFYRHARIVLDAVTSAEASIRQTDDVVRGDLRISVPPMIDEDFFGMISAFAKDHPAVRLQVHFSSRHVDLQRDGFDVALRAGSHIEPGIIARTLARQPVIAVASPQYLATNGTPRRKNDLKKHRCLMGFARGELPQTHWPVGGAMIHVEGSMFSNEIRLLANAAVHGLGIAFLPTFVVHEHLRSGALVQVLAGIVEADSRIAVVYPERELIPPQVRAFVEALVAWGARFAAQSEPARRKPTKPSRRSIPK